MLSCNGGIPVQTIQAKVNARLLEKADRLFTGTLEGRVIEILQNARRAGASSVRITSAAGRVTVRDDGRGIDDFSRLLDLGGSGWDRTLEASEDPAGVGLFSLAPRTLLIRSHGRRVTIDRQGWQGCPVSVERDPDPVPGTFLQFADEPWEVAAVLRHAVFTGMSVTVDGHRCPRERFVTDQAAHWRSLGCRIEVRRCHELLPLHRSWQRDRWAAANVLVNVHGQVVTFGYRPVHDPDLHFLVDLTGEPTGIRMMLPARTQPVENDAFEALKAALEEEAFRYVQRQGRHKLPYREYLRAKELGIDLPEAEPTFTVGLLIAEDPPPVEVVQPEGFPLARCHRLDPALDEYSGEATNIHLLAALGDFPEPFVPVEISSAYDGYRWADLPRITGVELTAGRVLHEDTLWGGRLACVENLRITATTSDHRTWSSPVCLAVQPTSDDHANAWWDQDVLITPEARERLRPAHILCHLGGYSDEGDTWETQEDRFSDELDVFWDTLLGPHETRRRRLFEVLRGLADWDAITLTPDHRMVIQHGDRSRQVIDPPGSRTDR